MFTNRCSWPSSMTSFCLSPGYRLSRSSSSSTIVVPSPCTTLAPPTTFCSSVGTRTSTLIRLVPLCLLLHGHGPQHRTDLGHVQDLVALVAQAARHVLH